MADLLYIFIAIYSIVQFFSGHFLFGFVLLIASSIAITVYDNKKQEDIEIEKINKEVELMKTMSPEERKPYDKQKKQERLDNMIDYTIIVAEDSKKSLGSAVARGAVGGVLLGPVGMVGGAISGKNKAKTTFTVVYKSGRREVITVDNDSSDFGMYARYIK